MSSLKQQITVKCPECDGDITLPTGTEQNEILECAECTVQLEVSNVSDSNATLVVAPEEGEDWGE